MITLILSIFRRDRYRIPGSERGFGGRHCRICKAALKVYLFGQTAIKGIPFLKFIIKINFLEDFPVSRKI